MPPWFLVRSAKKRNGTDVDPTKYLRVGSTISGAREDISMSQVLGAHYEHYQRAMTARARTRRSRGLVVIDDQDLVVQMSGHPRSFSGRAYIPGLVPQGMQIDAIQ